MEHSEDDEQDIGMCCAKVNMNAQKQIRRTAKLR